jgi:hypothetical protein
MDHLEFWMVVRRAWIVGSGSHFGCSVSQIWGGGLRPGGTPLPPQFNPWAYGMPFLRTYTPEPSIIDGGLCYTRYTHYIFIPFNQLNCSLVAMPSDRSKNSPRAQKENCCSYTYAVAACAFQAAHHYTGRYHFSRGYNLWNGTMHGHALRDCMLTFKAIQEVRSCCSISLKLVIYLE